MPKDTIFLTVPPEVKAAIKAAAERRCQTMTGYLVWLHRQEEARAGGPGVPAYVELTRRVNQP